MMNTPAATATTPARDFYACANGTLISGRLDRAAAERVAASYQRSYRRAVVTLVEADWADAWAGAR